MKTIYILWLRQLKRYIRKRSRIIGALGQPLIFLFAFGFGFSPIFERAGGGDYIQFLSPGIIAMTVLFTAIFTGVEVIWDKQFGFMKETLVAPVKRSHIMIGKTLGGATVAAIQGVIVFAVTLIAGFRPESLALIPVAVLFLILISIFFSALGTAIASRLDDMQSFPLIINFVVQPLFFLSGALFPVGPLPDVFKMITSLNPLSYGVDGLRYGLTGEAFYSPYFDAGVLVVLIVIILFIGSWLFKKVEA